MIVIGSDRANRRRDAAPPPARPPSTDAHTVAADRRGGDGERAAHHRADRARQDDLHVAGTGGYRGRPAAEDHKRRHQRDQRARFDQHMLWRIARADRAGSWVFEPPHHQPVARRFTSIVQANQPHHRCRGRTAPRRSRSSSARWRPPTIGRRSATGPPGATTAAVRACHQLAGQGRSFGRRDETAVLPLRRDRRVEHVRTNPPIFGPFLVGVET